MTKKDETQTLIRLPQSLLEDMKHFAEVHERSINGELVWALRQYVEKQKEKRPAPYVIFGANHDQNLRFYERYDEHFLFNKVVSFLHILDQGEPGVKQIEEHLIANGGPSLPKRYLESIRAEIFFTTLHQCEAFFALLIALFQPLPHWLYLTTYETKEIKQAVRLIVSDKISDLTGGDIANIREFVKVAVYSEIMTADPQQASRWDENIDNAAWLIKRIGEFSLRYDYAYNSYKHGLRTMAGPHQLAMGIESPDGMVRGPMHIIQSSEDSITYLQKEPAREVDGEKEIPISEVVKIFNPFEASFYLAKMNQMLGTIKATRLARLKDDKSVESINTFFNLDRDEIMQLEKHDELKYEPARADEARAYSQFVAQMQASAKQQTDNAEQQIDDTDSENGSESDGS